MTSAHTRAPRDASSGLSRYLIGFACAALITASPFAASALFLYQVGETLSPAAAVDRTRAQEGLYGTAVNANTPDVKLALVAATKPDVVALGSSRSLQFRHFFFTSSFANAGGVMGELEDARLFLEQMRRFHRPKMLILQLDHWWFLTHQGPRPTRPMAGPDAATEVTLQKLVRPYEWMLDGSLTPSVFLRGLVGGSIDAGWTGYTPIGVQANRIGRGLRADGSYLDAKLWIGESPGHGSEQFRQTLTNLARGREKWDPTRRLDPAMIADLQAIIDLARESAEEVVVFLPSLPAPVYQALDASPSGGAVRDIRAALADGVRSVPYFDFHNPATLDDTACEYLNGDHGGDVSYARILLAMAEAPGSPLAAHVDVDRLEALIERWRGHAFIPRDEDRYPYDEADFLGLGCEK